MARVLDVLPAKASGRTAKYPWDEWLDGGVYELVEGEDFTCSPSSIRQSAVVAAKQRGLKLATRGTADGVAIQASKNGKG